MKKTITSLLVLCFASISCFAQFGFTSAGFSFENQNIQTSFTIGEVFNQRIENSNFLIKNGILQPALKTSSSVYSKQTIEVSIYPNPVFDYINVDMEKPEDFRFAIFDYTGKMVQRNNLGTGKISVNDLSKGMYVLTLIAQDNSKFSYKFVK